MALHPNVSEFSERMIPRFSQESTFSTVQYCYLLSMDAYLHTGIRIRAHRYIHLSTSTSTRSRTSTSCIYMYTSTRVGNEHAHLSQQIIQMLLLISMPSSQVTLAALSISLK